MSMDEEPKFIAGPDGTALRIYRDTAKNQFQTEQLGRPIYDEVILVEVISPGSRGSTPVHEVERFFAAEANLPPQRGAKYAEYEGQIKQFKAGEEGENNIAGTPLREWPEISRSMAASLREQNVFSVEGLANIPDSRCAVIGPEGRIWREKARAYLEQTKDAGAATKYAAENERLRQQVEEQNNALSSMSTALTALQAQVSAMGGAPVALGETALAPAPLQAPQTAQDGLGLVPATQAAPAPLSPSQPASGGLDGII